MSLLSRRGKWVKLLRRMKDWRAGGFSKKRRCILCGFEFTLVQSAWTTHQDDVMNIVDTRNSLYNFVLGLL